MKKTLLTLVLLVLNFSNLWGSNVATSNILTGNLITTKTNSPKYFDFLNIPQLKLLIPAWTILDEDEEILFVIPGFAIGKHFGKSYEIESFFGALLRYDSDENNLIIWRPIPCIVTAKGRWFVAKFHSLSFCLGGEIGMS